MEQLTYFIISINANFQSVSDSIAIDANESQLPTNFQSVSDSIAIDTTNESQIPTTAQEGDDLNGNTVSSNHNGQVSTIQYGNGGYVSDIDGRYVSLIQHICN